MFNKIAFTFFIKTSVAVINLAIVVLLSQKIGAEGKGEASLILTSIAMLLLFTNIIGGASLIYFVPRYNVLQLFIISNIWSLIVCAASYFIFSQFNLVPAEFVFHVIALSFINSLFATNSGILLGKERIALNNLLLFFQAAINIVVLYFLIENVSQNNVFAYINSLYVSFGVCLLISILFVFKYLSTSIVSNINELIKESFRLGLYNQLGHFLKFLSFRFIYFIIAEYSGESALGLFSNSNSVTESVLLITNSYVTVLLPHISNSTNHETSKQITQKYTKHSIILCLLALLIVALLPDNFWIWLFGNEFIGLQKIIIILCPGILFYNVALIVGHYFSGIGKPQINTIGNFFGLIITFLLVWIVIPEFNLLQISLISTLSYFITTVVILIYFIKDTNSKIAEIIPTIKDFKDLKNDILLLIKK